MLYQCNHGHTPTDNAICPYCREHAKPYEPPALPDLKSPEPKKKSE